MNWRTTTTAPAPPAELERKDPAYLGGGTKISIYFFPPNWLLFLDVLDDSLEGWDKKKNSRKDFF